MESLFYKSILGEGAGVYILFLGNMGTRFFGIIFFFTITRVTILVSSFITVTFPNIFLHQSLNRGSFGRLYSITDLPFKPAEDQDEHWKEESDSGDDGKEWVATKGGFFANLSRRNSHSKINRVYIVDDIHVYKSLVVDERDSIVVVRFHASWCKSCRASEPLFKKLIRDFPDIKYVEVPLTKKTGYLQEGLGVPSVPFGHIYHPQAGLVEELRISKPHFSAFRDSLETYIKGSCQVEYGDDKIAVSGRALGAFE